MYISRAAWTLRPPAAVLASSHRVAATPPPSPSSRPSAALSVVRSFRSRRDVVHFRSERRLPSRYFYAGFSDGGGSGADGEAEGGRIAVLSCRGAVSAAQQRQQQLQQQQRQQQPQPRRL